MEDRPRHIYRDANGVLGGVCSGIALRFDIDAALVRVAVIILSLVSAGAFMLVYVAAWFVMPEQPTRDDALDISPESFKSDVYEQVVKRPAARGSSAAMPSIPPVPPSAASSYYAVHMSAQQPSALRAAPTAGQDVDEGKSRRPVSIGLVAGVALIALGAAALFSSFSRVFSPLQFWPLLLVVFGIVRIAIPAKDGSRTFTSWLGVLGIIVGAAALASSLGVYTPNFDIWLRRAAPMLLVAAGLFIMGRASKSNVLIGCAGAALLVFVALGVYFSLEDSAPQWDETMSFDRGIIIWEEGR